MRIATSPPVPLQIYGRLFCFFIYFKKLLHSHLIFVISSRSAERQVNVKQHQVWESSRHCP